MPGLPQGEPELSDKSQINKVAVIDSQLDRRLFVCQTVD
jgi:hypothetical protein